MRIQGRGRCITALLVAAALTASCATAPAQPSPAGGGGPARGDRLVSSDMLANSVYARLAANPIYYFRHVDVRVDQGVALLSGYVWSTDAIYAARRIAGSVPGVTGVVTTQLELERNGRGNGAAR